MTHETKTHETKTHETMTPKGVLLERYLLVLEMRKRYGWYDEQGNPCPDL